jgi:outer membrane protein assembly factor BamB
MYDWSYQPTHATFTPSYTVATANTFAKQDQAVILINPVGAFGNPTPTPQPSAGVDWDSFGYDLQRTDYNPNETVIGPGNVGSMTKLWAAPAQVGSTMVREPVLASGVMINGQPTNVLYAGSNFGATLYAINADTGATIWTKPVATAPYSCGSSSQYSIAASPAIDRARNRIYFADGQNNIHALDLSTGAEANGWPIPTIADYSGDHNFMHGGFTYNPANGMLYVVTSSSCDISPWYGRIVAINTSTAGIVGTFFPAQGSSGGGIWGPGGAAIDPATNNVFISTGNSDSSSDGGIQNVGYSEQIVELSPNLGSVLANNNPSLPISSTYDDLDFGATPLLFQPPGCPPLLAAVNKSGLFELYDQNSIGSGATQSIQMSITTDDGDFVGVPSYDPVTNYVYVGMPSTFGIYVPGLAAFSIQANCTLNPNPAWSAAFGPDAANTTGQTPRSPVTIANGVAYVSNYSGKTEFAFNAASGALLWSTPLTGYGVPGAIIANGKVYVSDSGGNIMAWGPSGSGSRSHLVRKKPR